jgi:hypothetical protein
MILLFTQKEIRGHAIECMGETAIFVLHEKERMPFVRYANRC